MTVSARFQVDVQTGKMGQAVFSRDGLYRYLLTRDLKANGVGLCTFIMLNPSTANADKNDPTVARCVSGAYQRDFKRLEVLNIFAFRSTDPAQLSLTDDPIGPYNDDYIQGALERKPDMLMLAWGNWGAMDDRGLKVLQMVKDSGVPAWCYGWNKATSLGQGTKARQPRHPLYLPKQTRAKRVTFG